MSAMTAAQIQSSYAAALKQQQAGNLNEALQGYGRIIQFNPKVAEAHFQIGRILTRTDQYEGAFNHLMAAARLRPAEIDIYRAWAEAVALGGSAEAEKVFLDALKAAPLPAPAKISLQDRFGARRTSTRPAAGGMRPDQIQNLITLMGQQKFAAAEKAAQQSAAAHPNSAFAYNVLATAQSALGNLKTAEVNFQKAIRLDPNYAEAHENLGRMYNDHGQHDRAMAHYRQAVILAPGLQTAVLHLANFHIIAGRAALGLSLIERLKTSAGNIVPYYIALGNAHTKLRNFVKAEDAYSSAVERSGGKLAEAVALLAQTQARLGKDDAAMENFNTALALDPDSAIATGGKASLLQTLGNFAEAEVLFRRGFELDPLNGQNYRHFIASHKTKPGDPVIDVMIEKFDMPLPDQDRMNLGFAIAKALEDVKDYDRVFKYLNEANALMRKAQPYQIAERFKQVEMAKEAFAGFDWHGTRIDGTTDFAPIFVTGMPRSGTTLVEQIISSHSRVTGAGELGEAAKSAQLLMADGPNTRPMGTVPHEDIAALGRQFESYVHARFSDTPQITDKSIQSYMFIGVLRLAMPNSRIVVVRRDPRDNLLSIYKNKFPDETHLYAYDQRDLGQYYGTFVEMVDFWRSQVPDWFYEVQYEELVANPEEETRKLIAACGLDWEDACLKPQENNRKVETLSVYQARQPISGGSVKAWQRYEKDLKPMLDALREGGHVAD
ncbi:MAG: sulfotransferase [Rhodobacteraceae bacterium]|nr:sulfotransferase [Paracoccaceae bacterium]